jgi:hypothetical protein
MDVSLLIISGLAGIGYYLNKNGKTSRDATQLMDSIPSSEIPNSYHVYENGNYTNVMNDRQRRADKLNQQSKDPENTRVIPALYNLKNLKPTKKKLLVLPPFGGKQQLQNQDQKKLLTKSSESIAPAVYNTQPEEMGGFGGITENFHNNMVPFYSGSQPKQDMRMDTYGGQMERLTGVGDVMYSSKAAVTSFAELSKNPNVFTTPELSDSMRARTNMAVSNKKQGEFLQQPMNVAPSTSGKPGILGSEGFHPMYREQERTVDELRANSNPKQSLDITDRVHMATGTTPNGPSRPEFHQNNPHREHVVGLKYAVAGASGAKANALRANTDILFPNNSRSTTGVTEYYGTGGSLDTQQGYISKNTYSDTNTIRDQTGNVKYLGPLGGAEQQTIYNTDPLHTTTKETISSSYTPNFGDNKGQGYKIVNQNDHSTGRETEHSSYLGPAQPTEHGAFISRDNVYNSEINALKSLTQHMREPTQVREKLVSGKESVGNYENFRSVRHVLNHAIPKFQNMQPSVKLDTDSKRGLNTQGSKDASIDTRNQNLSHDQLLTNPYVIDNMGLQPRSQE